MDHNKSSKSNKNLLDALTFFKKKKEKKRTRTNF